MVVPGFVREGFAGYDPGFVGFESGASNGDDCFSIVMNSGIVDLCDQRAAHPLATAGLIIL